MFAVFLAAIASAHFAPPQLPLVEPHERIIDVHRHAPPVGGHDQTARKKALRSMDENGIALSVLYINEPSDIRDWAAAAPKRFVASVAMPCWRNRDKSYYCFPKTAGWPDPVAPARNSQSSSPGPR